MLGVDQIRRRRKATEHDRRAHRHNQNGKEHHHTLNEVRTRHSKKAADERIEHDHRRACKESRQIRQLKNCLKEPSRCHKSRGRIEDKKDQDKDGGNNAQCTGLCKKTVFKEIRQRQ